MVNRSTNNRKIIKLVIKFLISSTILFNFESRNTEFDFHTISSIFYPKNRKQSDKLTITKNMQFPERELMILVYMAADNDLHYFAWNNIKQLANGANNKAYIVVQLNEPGKNKKTQLYLIEKNRAILLNKDNQKKLDSGDPQTLIDFCTFSIQVFPAKKHILILSNHGSGIIDRNSARLINPTEFFVLNPSNLMLELDRSIEFLKFLDNQKSSNIENNDPKGLCFDETYQTYFTNQKLEYALSTICKEAAKILNKNEFKFSILGMDACLMQMIEIANIIKNFANLCVASEEVELGPGWRYDKILKILENSNFDHVAFAKHIVKAYQDTYSGITNDFTLSAINLELINSLEKNINSVAENLIDMLQNQKNNSFRNILKKSKSSVAFEEPSYIDLYSFYSNVLNHLKVFGEESDDHIVNENNNFNKLKTLLEQNIKEGLKILETIIIENVAGNNIKYAKGIAIYFPEERIHNSYRKTNFAQSNQWINFLLHYTSLG